MHGGMRGIAMSTFLLRYCSEDCGISSHIFGKNVECRITRDINPRWNAVVHVVIPR